MPGESGESMSLPGIAMVELEVFGVGAHNRDVAAPSGAPHIIKLVAMARVRLAGDSGVGDEDQLGGLAPAEGLRSGRK